ncbi:hypothetical protein FQN54_006818 [Arachnomyces sp. PD_36]|nr:hypothetical protein FQN54_006818 [Arachnomyces sp. PD_36]
MLEVGWLLGLGGLFTLIMYNICLHPLASYPGPKACAATRIPYFWALLTGNLVGQVSEWHREYGPVVRIAPDELSYASADAWHDIYGNRQNHAQVSKDPRFYSAPLSNTPVDKIADKADETRYRHSLAQAFAKFSIRHQEPLVKGYVDMLIMRLYQQIEMGSSSIDMVKWYTFTTFDIIRDLAFGESFGCLENSQYHGWISMVLGKIRFGVYLNVIKRIPGGQLLLRFLSAEMFGLFQPKHKLLTPEQIDQSLNNGQDKITFLSQLLRLNDPSRQMTATEVMANSSAFILAGSETTATALCGITYCLLSEPAAMKKLVEEVRGAFNSEDEITISSSSKLKYMMAVINEGLRMYPAVPIGLPRVVEGKGIVIDGAWVPGGTTVAVSQVSANRSPLNFAHPDRFIPERFLDDPEFASDKRDALQPFLTGPRNCLGKALAYAEMRLILARIFWNFDMKLHPDVVDWSDQRTYFLWEKKPLKVQLVPASMEE